METKDVVDPCKGHKRKRFVVQTKKICRKEKGQTKVSEYQDQSALFQWAELSKKKYPGLELMFAVPNGQMRRGMRPEPGLKSGVPDIFLPVSKNEFHGLFIEMKCVDKKKGRLSNNQKLWLHDLGVQGYATSVCYGVDQAIESIVDYFQTKIGWIM